MWSASVLLGPAIGQENALLGPQAVARHDGLAGDPPMPPRATPSPRPPTWANMDWLMRSPAWRARAWPTSWEITVAMTGFVPGVLQDAGEDAHLAAGQTEGVGLLAVKDHKLPAVIRAAGPRPRSRCPTP